MRWLYKGRSKSNASYFILLFCNVRGGCCWYGSRGWTLPPVSHYMFLLCDRWQQRGKLGTLLVFDTEVWMKHMYRWITPCGKKGTHWHSLILVKCCWRPKWMWAQWSSGWCISAVVPVTVSHPTGADCYKRDVRALVHHWWKCIANGGDYVEKEYFVAENLLYQIVLVCFLYLL